MMSQTRKIGFRFKFVLAVVFYLLTLVFGALNVNAIEDQFVTIVNPVRIPPYKVEVSKSLLSEYSVVKSFGFPATWLLTYDALQDDSILEIVKKMDDAQSFGLFLEVTQSFSESAGIAFNDTGNWHHATSVFLSGYSQEDRLKLIDLVFKKFKDVFGYYPKVVGSWWTDAYSLGYMRDKYEISANLGVSDQFSTDGYQVWGQPWGMPYYPSRFHTGIPAGSNDDKLDVVVLQWAPRDPLNGYSSSLYSTQDYVVVGKELDTTYFSKLINLYLDKSNNGFGQVTIGLESDLNPDGYKGEYGKQLQVVSGLVESGIQVISVENFADWYRTKFPDISPTFETRSEDLLGGKQKVIWHTTPNYRVGVILDYDTNQTKIIDIRVYNPKLTDPYFISPNRENNLNININPEIDSISEPDSTIALKGIAEIDYLDNGIIVNGKKMIFQNIEGLEKYGTVYRALSSESRHFFRRKSFIFDLISGNGWENFRKSDFIIPQDEIIALNKLSHLPYGKVLVYDNECLQCEYHTQLKHPAFANQRGYVKKYGKHSIVYDSSIFKPENKFQLKKIAKKLGIKYIYLVKFEGYIEKLPFSPGDMGIEKVFSNANAEIWRII